MARDSHPVMVSIQSILGAPGVQGERVTPIPKDGLTDFIQSIIKKQESEEPFSVLDLGVVVSLVNKWTHCLPTVRPFYAVKCNPHRALLGALAALGAGFDCASKVEIESVLSLGVSPDRIIYANPCKAESHIRYSASVGVNLTTFDSIDEVEKIRKSHPTCALLIRIKGPSDSRAMYPLDSKYGALPEEIVPLLQSARDAGLNVLGVSFHVGSGATHCNAYESAISSARMVFDVALKLGMPRMNVLNIGGGFSSGPLFDDASTIIKLAINKYFQNEVGLKIMAEPGRFFAGSSFRLATSIIGKRVRGQLREYWINDGVFGSFNVVLFGETVAPMTLACSSNPNNPCCRGEKTHCSTLFGPTCDAVDTVLKDQQLPELKVSDWLMFPTMGAYTTAIGSNFNGFNRSCISTHLIYSLDTTDGIVCK